MGIISIQSAPSLTDLGDYFTGRENGVWGSDQHNYVFDYSKTYIHGIVFADMVLTGIVAPSPTRKVVVPIRFESISGSCTIKHLDTASSNSNIIYLPNEEDLVVEPYSTYWFFYDDLVNKWFLGMQSNSSDSTSAYREITSTDTFTAGGNTINCTSGTYTVNLPTAVDRQGKIYVLKNSGAGTITLDGFGTETIDGSLTATILPSESLSVQSTGANWIII